MDVLFLTMRILHICLGVFWAGALVFVAFLLMPSVRDAAPEGGKVMLALMRRGYMNILPVVAILTLVSGFWLYWNTMETVGPLWASSMSARVYGAGAVAAVVAFLLGIFVLRPTGKKLQALMEQMANTPEGQARATVAEEMNAPRARMAATAPWVAVLLAIATICMAVGRYV